MSLPAFAEVALVLLAAVVLGGIGLVLRQPLIVAFIGVGILVGPTGLGVVTQHEEIELLASIGIAMLLFVVGLKLDVHLIRTVGPVALATGLGQVIFTSLIGFGITLALGYPPLSAAYIAVALTFSSTIIIVKLLSDKREIDALHGRIAVGFLIVQDLAVILVMIGLTAVGAGLTAEADVSMTAQIARVAVRGVAFLAVVVAMMRWVLPRLTGRFAHSVELLVLFAIAWAVALAAGGEVLGFSKEVGAFLAGVALASTPYREAIAGRLVTVRDFLLLFFFIDLGVRLDLSHLGATTGPALVLSAFVLVGNPLIVMVIMGLMGYRKRTSFLAGLTVAQISEFSLILGALGLTLGHIDPEAMGLITVVGLITIGLSTYLILYSAPIYERLAPFLGIFERRTAHPEGAGDTPQPPPQADVVLFGLGRYGGGIARQLRLRNRRVVGVDFDPQALARWREAGVTVVYGDGEDPELLERLPLAGARWVVSTVPDIDTNRVLLRHLGQLGYAGKVAVACRTPDEEETLRVEGAAVILRPFAAAAEQAADVLTSAMDGVERLAAHAAGLREARVSPGSTFVGRTIGETRLRERLGVTVLAVSRAGRAFLNVGPEFQLFPGDRLILAGEPDALEQAVAELSRFDPADTADEPAGFAVAELPLASARGWHGRTLADLELRNRFGVTVVNVRRPTGETLTPPPHRVLQPDDRLIVAGAPFDLERLKAVVSHSEPLDPPTTS